MFSALESHLLRSTYKLTWYVSKLFLPLQTAPAERNLLLNFATLPLLLILLYFKHSEASEPGRFAQLYGHFLQHNSVVDILLLRETHVVPVLK